MSSLSVADSGYDGRSSAPPAAYRDHTSRGSIASVNGQQPMLQQMPGSGSSGVSPSPLGRGESPPRRQSPPIMPTTAAAVPAPSNGGSTFDDILKGMEGQKKKKKGLFF